MNMDWRPVARRIRRQVRNAGFDIVRDVGTLAKVRASVLRPGASLSVVDVGANAGQWAQEVRQAGFDGTILSLEPLLAAYDSLSSASAGDSRWTASRVAASDTSGTASLTISGNSVSSSLDTMLGAHRAAAPASAPVGHEDVPVATLDAILDEAGLGAESLYLKVDTQGHEHKVLAGARRALQHAVAVELELSLVPLYEGQTLAPQLISALYDDGFVLAAMEKVFWHPETHQLLQIDGLFLRTSSLT